MTTLQYFFVIGRQGSGDKLYQQRRRAAQAQVECKMILNNSDEDWNSCHRPN